jgi:hypothetical protein
MLLMVMMTLVLRIEGYAGVNLQQYKQRQHQHQYPGYDYAQHQQHYQEQHVGGYQLVPQGQMYVQQPQHQGYQAGDYVESLLVERRELVEQSGHLSAAGGLLSAVAVALAPAPVSFLGLSQEQRQLQRMTRVIPTHGREVDMEDGFTYRRPKSAALAVVQQREEEDDYSDDGSMGDGSDEEDWRRQQHARQQQVGAGFGLARQQELDVFYPPLQQEGAYAGFGVGPA